MRWIFISLALVNLATLVWALVARPDSSAQSLPQKQKNPYAQFQEISLLSEIGQAQAREAESYEDESQELAEELGGQELQVSAEEEVEQREGVDSVVEIDGESLLDDSGSEQEVVESAPLVTPEPVIPMHGDKMLCDIVGPFESKVVANDFIERLKAVDVSSKEKELELPAGMGYWVYLEPLSNRREALRMLSELQAKRIDSYVIPRGDLANGISLGMFSKKALSDARVKKMKSIGLEPLVEEIERTYRELWVMLEPGESSKMSQITWDRVMEGINELERRQNYCLDVASE